MSSVMTNKGSALPAASCVTSSGQPPGPIARVQQTARTDTKTAHFVSVRAKNRPTDTKLPLLVSVATFGWQKARPNGRAILCAQSGNRTRTVLLPQDFESSASTNSAIRAGMGPLGPPDWTAKLLQNPEFAKITGRRCLWPNRNRPKDGWTSCGGQASFPRSRRAGWQLR